MKKIKTKVWFLHLMHHESQCFCICPDESWSLLLILCRTTGVYEQDFRSSLPGLKQAALIVKQEIGKSIPTYR